MKWQLPLAIAAALFLGSISTTAQAEDAKPKRPFPGKFEKGKGRPEAGKGKEAFLKRFDKDGDGKISDAEKAAIREAFAARKKDKK